MKVAVGGGSGLIGKHLIRDLLKDGHEVILISRSPSSELPVPCITWADVEREPMQLNGMDAIVNLSGESINQRWTSDAKKRITLSRLQTTEAIAACVSAVPDKPKVVINGSGMSIYGTSETDTFDESSPHRITDFLAGVVEKWEQAATAIRGTRVVLLRTGIVLDRKGGAMPKMLMPYRIGAGGRIGNGTQWMSWIHMADMIGIIRYAIEHTAVMGPVNCTAPFPVLNDEFGRMAAKVLHRPHWLPIPAFVFKLAFGEMSVLLLEGQRVLPKRIQQAGYTFRYPQLAEALTDLLQPH